jgi:hypothetical protein
MIDIDEIKGAASRATDFIDDEEERYYNNSKGLQYDKFIEGAQWAIQKIKNDNCSQSPKPIKVLYLEVGTEEYISLATGKEETHKTVAYKETTADGSTTLSELIESLDSTVKNQELTIQHIEISKLKNV